MLCHGYLENELERVDKEQEAAWNTTEAGNSTEKKESLFKLV